MAGGRADWDDNLTKFFLDLCIAEKQKLNYSNKKGLTKTGWNNVYRNFRQQTGRRYTEKQMQNKFNSLKRLYKVWRKLKSASGGGQNSNTGTITMDAHWWNDRIAEDQLADTFRRRPLSHENELDILFGSMETEDGNMVCVGGIGDGTPSRGSEGNRTPHSDDSLSESFLQNNKNEASIRREQDEIARLLQIVETDGVDQGSELYFIATELFRSAARRAAFQTIRTQVNRISWLRWTWDNIKK